MAANLRMQAPSTLDYFAALVAEDKGFPTLEAAVSLAQDEDPRLDLVAVLAQIDELALRLSTRIAADAAPLQRLRLLNHYFYQELGFAGNINHYHDAGNSLLPTVLQTRRGIPISLALLYIEIAGQIGLKAQGVSFPGHFLVKLLMPAGEVVIDPFTGQSLSHEDLDERLEPFRARQAALGQSTWALSQVLRAASGREWIARMLGNLRELYRSQADWPRLQQVQARRVILLPQAWEEHRDHALVLAKLGKHAQAAKSLSIYLRQRPDAPDAPALLKHLAAWNGLH